MRESYLYSLLFVISNLDDEARPYHNERRRGANLRRSGLSAEGTQQRCAATLLGVRLSAGSGFISGAPPPLLMNIVIELD